MATIMPPICACLVLAYLVLRWWQAASPAQRVTRETAQLQAYLAWKPGKLTS